jgi:hypothetical protein
MECCKDRQILNIIKSNLYCMSDTLLGLCAGATATGIGLMTVALLTSKICPVCDHVLTQGAERCPYCLYEF